MFARVTEIEIIKDEIDEAIRVYKEEVIPLRHLRKGSRGGYLLVDRETGKSIAITFWESREYQGNSDEESQYVVKQKIFKSHLSSDRVDLGLYEVCTEG
ncbi:hypothetical protein ACFLVP_04310 [Chloroflexota bacterium]